MRVARFGNTTRNNKHLHIYVSLSWSAIRSALLSAVEWRSETSKQLATRNAARTRPVVGTSVGLAAASSSRHSCLYDTVVIS